MTAWSIEADAVSCPLNGIFCLRHAVTDSSIVLNVIASSLSHLNVYIPTYLPPYCSHDRQIRQEQRRKERLLTMKSLKPLCPIKGSGFVLGTLHLYSARCAVLTVLILWRCSDARDEAMQIPTRCYAAMQGARRLCSNKSKER